MTASIDSHPDKVSQAADQGMIALQDLPDEVTGPIMAGVRARRLVDCCEAGRVSAVLIDRAGRVLHATSGTAELLDRKVSVQADHLVGHSANTDERLQALLTAALDAGLFGSVSLGDEDERGLVVTAVDYADRSPYQLLKLVLVLAADREQAQIGAAMVRDEVGRPVVH